MVPIVPHLIQYDCDFIHVIFFSHYTSQYHFSTRMTWPIALHSTCNFHPFRIIRRVQRNGNVECHRSDQKSIQNIQSVQHYHGEASLHGSTALCTYYIQQNKSKTGAIQSSKAHSMYTYIYLTLLQTSSPWCQEKLGFIIHVVLEFVQS